MPQFRKKPVVIEARQLTPNSSDEIKAWCGGHEYPDLVPAGAKQTYSGELLIPTLEGPMHARFGDYVICGVQGEFYPCRNAIFLQTYEPVEDVPAVQDGEAS